MDIAGRTLLQRVAPTTRLGGISGALEGLHDLMLAVGSIGVPILIAILGARGATLLAGVWLPIIVLAGACGEADVIRSSMSAS